jgi:hypothetical protein
MFACGSQLVLQNTLANLCASIYMTTEKRFKRVVLSNSKATNGLGREGRLAQRAYQDVE